MRQYHVAVAAEAYVAGLLAQAGFDVSIQYGANQPEYDLIASKDDRLIKVSVKGSQDGGWVLIAGHKKKGVSYHEAIDNWRTSHKDQSLLYAFVQFKSV